jgi:hypothetical protein
MAKIGPHVIASSMAKPWPASDGGCAIIRVASGAINTAKWRWQPGAT